MKKTQAKMQWYENEIATTKTEGEVISTEGFVSNPATQEDFAAVSTAADYLPRLQLCGSSTDLAKEGKIGIGRYALIFDKNTFTDLGEEVDVVVIEWRPKALEIGDEIVASHDPKSELFQSISEKAEVPNSGCMFGPEFLVWVPEVGKFATFFLGSKTAKRQGSSMSACMLRPAKLRSKLIKTPKHSWHGPEVLPSSESLELPDAGELAETQAKFINPPESSVEIADTPSGDRET